MNYNMYELIMKKRDGGELTRPELGFWLSGMLKGSIPDYQTAAMLMAIFWRGMSEREIFDLTAETVASGEQLDLSSLPGVTVDKHSTGGVGDKTTLIAMPLAAACGLTVAKMSGRSLGKTGGTVDKLASVPGFRLEMSEQELLNQAAKVGLAVISQTKNLTPADKRLYTLRDMTATVDSLPLIAASVMSKKLAAGAGVIVLDVKCGSGAFMANAEAAKKLAELMVKIGREAGRKVSAVISNMEAPLGAAVGNALEVAEAAEILQGREESPAVASPLRRLSLVLCAEQLYLGGLAKSRREGMELAEQALNSGRGWRKLLEFLQAQGGDTAGLEEGRLVQAPVELPVLAEEAGFLGPVNAAGVAVLVQRLGAGRERVEDEINYQVGVRLHKACGEAVSPGDKLATVYAAGEEAAREAAAKLRSIMQVRAARAEAAPLIYGIVDENSFIPGNEL